MSMGVCRSCGRTFRLRKDGCIPWHRVNPDSKRTLGDNCYGAALKPKAEKPPKPVYVRTGKVIDDVRAIAREHGYAIAVHGSLRTVRDIDLIAAPWVKEAHAPRTLMRAINRLPYLSRVKAHDNDPPKPHGRLGYVWIIQHRAEGCCTFVDLSVMPRG